MSLDQIDTEIVRDVVIQALEAVVLPRFDEHDKRFDRLEADVAVLKTDVAVLKTDVAELKTDVAVLKTDMREVKSSLSRLEGKVEALEADTKELYEMVARLQNSDIDKDFTKLSLEKKLLRLNADLLQTAQEAGIVLPR